MLQTGQIGKATVLHLIVTKLDELLKDRETTENVEAATRLERDFEAQFRSRVAKTYFWRLAARPLDGSMPTEEIIAKLFATCAGSSYRYTNIVPHDLTPTNFSRDFCRFGP